MSVTVPDAAWRHVPLRLDVERWATRQVRRRVLAVVHTVTSGQRLLEAVRLLEGETRVQVVFTAAPDVFSHGVDDFLARMRALVLPWSQAVQTEFDLALAASHGALHELHAPVVVLSHGAGHNKFVPARAQHTARKHTPRKHAAKKDAAPKKRTATQHVSTGTRVPEGTPARDVYGLSRQRLVRDGAVIPEAIVLSHQEELARLGRECPEALPAAEVVGDPCYDRIAASLPSRALYREALDVAPGQQLVLFCSTWGPRSLLGQDWELLERLTSELPREEYRVAALLHPNVWNTHGEWQIRSWLAELCRAGLAVVSQYADWRGALVAGDYIVGDHGSLSLYGTMTSAPVLMTGHPEADVDPDSPLAELCSFAYRLLPDRPLRRQLNRSAATYRPRQYERVAARITSEPGQFARKMRQLIYRKLRLRAPSARLRTEPARLPHTLPYEGSGALSP
ncbi:hypothetical protein ACWGJ2_13605 [Streptomyces sp. NPDC054796]